MARFRIINVDELIAHHTGNEERKQAIHCPDIGFSFYPDRRSQSVQDPSLIHRIGKTNLGPLASAEAASGLQHGTWMGEMHFADCHVIGRYGILLSTRHKTVYAGHSVRWHSHQIELFLPRSLPSAHFADGHIEIDDSELSAFLADPAAQHDMAYSGTGCGIHVYGHLLVDIGPQIFASAQSADATTPLITTDLPLAKRFCSMLNPTPPLEYLTNDKSCISVRNLVAMRCGRARAVWDDAFYSAYAEQVFNALSLSSANENRRIYLSRASWRGGLRTYSNNDDVMAFFERAGWEIIAPERLDFADQIRLFSEARFIAGDDGSALHSALFACPSPTLISLNHWRENLIHYHIANLKGRNVVYVESNLVTGSGEGDDSLYRMPKHRLEALMGLLDTLD